MQAIRSKGPRGIIPGTPQQARTRRLVLALGLIVLNIGLAIIIFLHFRNAPPGQTITPQPLGLGSLGLRRASINLGGSSTVGQRTSLLAQIDAWNAAHPQEAIHLVQQPTGRGAAITPSPATGPRDTMSQLQLAQLHQARDQDTAASSRSGTAGTTTGTTLPAGVDLSTCDPPDPDPRYRMRPREDVARENPELVAKLQQHAINNEIMLALANGIMICKNTTICWWDGGNILESFLTILQHNNITNYLIGVMDDETEVYLRAHTPPVNWFRVHIAIPDAQKKSHPANQVSTIKYTLLKTFLQLGYHTLITDMDLVYTTNPFHHLYRDADVEIQTDGFDETAYGVMDGIRDPTMGWGGGGLFIKLFTTNVGCMWVKANGRSFKLMEQVSRHLAEKPGWDQQIFNEYLLRPSHGGWQSAYARLRVLDIDTWLNSKIFFRSRRSRYLPGAASTAPTPVLIHMNYHPDKHKRMLCLMDRYFYGKVGACDAFPGGSDPGT